MTTPKPAVFLDRDGTLIEHEERPKAKADIRIFSFAAEAVRRLNELGYLVIVHTNQSMIEKGEITREDYDALNDYMVAEFAKSGAHIDRIYTCPHRYIEGREDRCRKPEPGLIEQAQTDFSIDMNRSWLVGDTTRDMETGKRLGLTTVLVKTGKAGGGEDAKFFDTKGDYEAENLEAATEIIEQAGQT